MPVALVAGAAIVAAGAAASAVAKKRAADKAASAQKDAISAQESLLRRRLDPETLNTLATRFDQERAVNRQALLERVDPEIARLRQVSTESLLTQAQLAPGSRPSEQVAQRLFEEGITADPRIEALKTSIIERAQEDLQAGATLPPEFQAELVRTGLAAGGVSGIGTAGQTLAGPTARLLGQAGVQLAAQRVAEAQNLANTAQSLTDARQRILANIFPAVAATEQAELRRATTGLATAESLLPEAGLSGAEAVDIAIAQSKGQANLLAQRGQLAGQQALARGELTGALIGAGTSLASGGLGAYQGYLNTVNAPVQNYVTAPGTNQLLDIGMYGRRTPSQQQNFNTLSYLYS